MSVKTILLFVVMTGLVILAAVAGVHALTVFGSVTMSVHAYIALGLGLVLTSLVGGGLMALVFVSSRRGYDDRAGEMDRV